uniref:Uncharacterized protein n=1 Tax=Strongyloides papillosus TaxID=174720 RepID=A0A0N5CJ13_STREA
MKFEEYSQLGESEKLSTICIAQHQAILSEKEWKVNSVVKDLLNQKDEENSANSSEITETSSLIKFSDEERNPTIQKNLLLKILDKLQQRR